MNESCFPLLAELAKRYLRMAVSSVACERVFNNSDGIDNARRNRLAAESVDMWTFSTKNL